MTRDPIADGLIAVLQARVKAGHLSSVLDQLMEIGHQRIANQEELFNKIIAASAAETKASPLPARVVAFRLWQDTKELVLSLETKDEGTTHFALPDEDAERLLTAIPVWLWRKRNHVRAVLCDLDHLTGTKVQSESSSGNRSPDGSPIEGQKQYPPIRSCSAESGE